MSAEPAAAKPTSTLTRLVDLGECGSDACQGSAGGEYDRAQHGHRRLLSVCQWKAEL